MRRFSKTKRRFGFYLLVVVFLAVFLSGGVWALRTWYFNSLKPASTASTTSYFTVTNGSNIRKIGTDLKSAHLIRSAKAFETYVRSNVFNSTLQAGTYLLTPSMSTQQIVKKMINGDVVKNLLTILPGKRLDEIKEIFKKNGYNQSQIDYAFNPVNYTGHPALASLPPGKPLEGYLYPDSFQKQTDTPAQTIIIQSLNEMNRHLTPDILSGFTAQGLNTYQGLTLASIIGQETSDPSVQPIVAQVFLLRLKQNTALGSDVTAFYGAALAGKPKNVNVDSPYNTRLHPGLPPTPIGNVTADSLMAAAHPATTNYLFFVAGDDGVIHFSHTAAEHEQAIRQYCKQGCGQ